MLAVPVGGAEVVDAANGDECLRIVADVALDLVLLDLVMPGRYG